MKRQRGMFLKELQYFKDYFATVYINKGIKLPKIPEIIHSPQKEALYILYRDLHRFLYFMVIQQSIIYTDNYQFKLLVFFTAIALFIFLSYSS